MRLRLARLLCLGLVLAPFAGQAEGRKGSIEYRQNVMKGVGADMGAIGDILKYDLDLLDNVAIHAARLERSAALIPSAFERKVVEGPTDAKKAIWRKPERFRTVTEDFRREAARLVELVRNDSSRGAVRAQVKALGKACGSCHKPFRKAKENSYKRAQ